MDWLSPERYAAELDSETARLAAATARLAPAAPVPACPEWTTRDLVAHVGTGHRFASELIEQRRQAPVGYGLIDAPDDPAEWPQWLSAGARRLSDAVAGLGSDGPVWTWQPKYRTAGFWQRRMLHDLIVHRFDARDESDIAPDLAIDGVDDILHAFEFLGGLPARDAGKLAGDGETLLFTATDTGDSWHVTLNPGGIAWRHGAAGADVTCAAPSTELLLILNRRREPATLDGDTALYERWRESSRF